VAVAHQGRELILEQTQIREALARRRETAQGEVQFATVQAVGKVERPLGRRSRLTPGASAATIVASGAARTRAARLSTATEKPRSAAAGSNAAAPLSAVWRPSNAARTGPASRSA
jgi:hypothetical protein